MEPHFVLFPYMLPGHMIPLIDIAKLIAQRGILVTILTTPLNANRFKTTIDRAVEKGHLKIQVIQLHFPCVEVGLPLGCENGDMLNSLDLGVTKLYKASCMLEPEAKKVIQELKPPPSCLISDMCLPWTTQMALSLHIPRIIFDSSCCFAKVCIHNLSRMFAENSNHGASSDDITEYFVVPGLPDRIELTKAQLAGGVGSSSTMAIWGEIFKQMLEAEEGAFGVAVNTFEDLELEYIKEYKKIYGKEKVWCIGPVSLCNTDQQDQAERGNHPSVNDQEILKFLDSLQPKSALYVCLGSLACLSVSQLIELGLGLELSNQPFIWVLRCKLPEAFIKWLEDEKFEERVIKNGGMLIRGWAPQVLILSHPSVGGFLTHCGWNSVLEGISAGLPLITWPIFAEQFCNEKLIMNVLGIGVRVGVEVPVVMGEEENIGVQVSKENVMMVVEKLMHGGEEGEMRRNRVNKLGAIARKVVEDGGSSNLAVTNLIQDVTQEVNQF
ncbi:glycosyltransferase [Lithospermum erythrorhizon]|uniref:Glycosyltransferase n=1 Tax=Lithospermum erythrorhizon TaxID=34254 RepID=A0AAV3PCW3_LITER